jgi:hypothetical protein
MVGIKTERRMVLPINQSVSKEGRKAAIRAPLVARRIIQILPFFRDGLPKGSSFRDREANAHRALSRVDVSAHIAITTKRGVNRGA